MTALNYRSLATSWIPDSQDARQFYVITACVLVVLALLAVLVSNVDVPEKQRVARKAIPERVAKFITEKKKPEIPKPVATPPPPKPIPTPKPKVVRKQETEAEKKKPLTVEEKKAREKASNSGLLALGSELADLMDTSEVSAMVGAKVKKSSASQQQASVVDTSALNAGAAKGSGGVDTSEYVTGVSGSTELTERDAALVKQSLFKDDTAVAKTENETKGGRARGAVRSEEEVTIVFDRNKGQLFSIYNRERRKKPGLKGKIVLEITIAPSGKVTKVSIVSSELNDPSLERRLISRVKQFKFEEKDVAPVTVTFPVEFLPS